MLRRSLRHSLLAFLAFALVIVPGVLVIFRDTHWWQQRLQEIVTRQLSETVKREVAIGPVHGDPLTGITVEGLAIAEGKTLAGGALFTARRVVIVWDLWSVLRWGTAPSASISTIDLYQARCHINRDHTGRFNFQDLLPPPTKVPPSKRFRGLVRIHDSALVYSDQARYVRTGSMQIHAANLQAVVDMSKVVRGNIRGTADITDGKAHNLSTNITFDTDPFFLDIAAKINNLDAAWAYQTFGPTGTLRLREGRADLNGALYVVTVGKRKPLDFSINGILRGVTVTDRRLLGPMRLDGGIWASQAGLQARDLGMTWGGNRYAVTGSLNDYKRPLLDLSLVSNNARLTPLVSLLPPQSRQQFTMPASGSGQVRVAAIGPLTNPDLRLQLALNGAIKLHLRNLGDIAAQALNVKAELVNAAKPSGRATIKGTALSLPKLPAQVLQGTKWPKELVIAPLKPFSADVQWCGGHPVAQATLQASAIRADNLHIGNLQTRATLVNDLLRVEGLRATVLGGTLTADAALGLKAPRQALRVRGRLAGVDLSRLAELPDSPQQPVSGRASADFQAYLSRSRLVGSLGFSATNVRSEDLKIANMTGTAGLEHVKQWRGAATVNATGVQQGDLEASVAHALLELHDEDLTLNAGYFQSPDGVILAKGVIHPRTQEAELEVQGAELAMGPISDAIGLRDFSGLGYLSGTLIGSLKKPEFSGKLTMFHPQFQKYDFDALTANVTFRNNAVEADQLLLSRGPAVISGNATIANLGHPAAQMGLQAALTAEGLDLKQVADLLDRKWPIAGLATATAKVTGSMTNPRIAGIFNLSNARYDEYVVTQAKIPYVYDGTEIAVGNATAEVFDAPVEAHGTLTLAHPTRVDGYLKVGDIRLEGLAPLWHSDVPLGGTIRIPQMWVRGPSDDLQGGGEVQAHELFVGREKISDVNANLTLSKGQVALQETTFQLANGRVVVSGAVNYAQKPQIVEARVGLVQTKVSDLLDLAVPVAQLLDRRAASERQDLQTTLRSYALRLQGVLDGSIGLTGSVNNPSARTDIHGTKLVLDNKALPDIDGQATVSKSAVNDITLALRQNDALVTVDGDLAFDGPIAATIEGSGINVAQLRPWIPLQIPYGGQLGFTVVASGQTRQPDLIASVDVNNPSFAGVGFDVLNLPVAKVTEGQIAVDTLVVKRGEQEILVDGQLPFSWHVPVDQGAQHRPGLIPSGAVKLKAGIAKTELAFFLPLIDEYLKAHRPAPATPGPDTAFHWASIEAKGAVDSSVTVTGTVQDPTITGSLIVADGSLLPKGWTHPVAGLQADAEFVSQENQNWMDLRRLDLGYDQMTAKLNGKVGLNFLKASEFWRNPMDLTLALAAKGQSLPGGTHLTNLGGGLTLKTAGEEKILASDNLAFDLGGGHTTLTGQARLTNYTLAKLANNQYDFKLTMAPGRVIYQNLINAMVGGNLSITTPTPAAGREPKALVQGKWTLHDGALGLLSPGGEPGKGLHAFRSSLPSPDLDVRVAIDDGVRVRGSGVNTPLEPAEDALHLTGTPQRPTVAGRIASRQGTTSLPTASLRLNELNANYILEPVPGDRHDPMELRLRGNVQGSAETSISRPGEEPIHILISISGNLPDQLSIVTSSDPALTQNQIYALLGGIPFAYIPGVGSKDPNLTSMVSEQFLATLANAFKLRVFEPIEEELRRFFGLSELGFNFAFDQPVTVQVGKYIVRNLLVSYERPISGNTDIFDLRLSYQLPGGLRVTYHNDERNIQRIEIGKGFTF